MTRHVSGEQQHACVALTKCLQTAGTTSLLFVGYILGSGRTWKAMSAFKLEGTKWRARQGHLVQGEVVLLQVLVGPGSRLAQSLCCFPKRSVDNQIFTLRQGVRAQIIWSTLASLRLRLNGTVKLTPLLQNATKVCPWFTLVCCFRPFYATTVQGPSQVCGAAL